MTIEEALPEMDKTAPHGSYPRWLWIVACSMAWSADKMEQGVKTTKAAAEYCAKESAAGRPTNAWHGIAVATNTVDRCHCAVCEAKRRDRN